ncbi:hypothetical protein IQ235_06825 [Oscillatoriales cyanobacterium LEGE 11467]|uniref:Uncharacterized protein n=1 Tax=Zarconia navalis LEGE 11467 TaxID=1828826 RepID=A0A928VXE0_9CYAN|nr:hypothetical protein [Zarconia navalis]MBE9040502.1 hypothetical protein [Zarconia navalis LEGE 11467]
MTAFSSTCRWDESVERSPLYLHFPRKQGQWGCTPARVVEGISWYNRETS